MTKESSLRIVKLSDGSEIIGNINLTDEQSQFLRIAEPLEILMNSKAIGVGMVEDFTSGCLLTILSKTTYAPSGAITDTSASYGNELNPVTTRSNCCGTDVASSLKLRIFNFKFLFSSIIILRVTDSRFLFAPINHI